MLEVGSGGRSPGSCWQSLRACILVPLVCLLVSCQRAGLGHPPWSWGVGGGTVLQASFLLQGHAVFRGAACGRGTRAEPGAAEPGPGGHGPSCRDARRRRGLLRGSSQSRSAAGRPGRPVAAPAGVWWWPPWAGGPIAVQASSGGAPIVFLDPPRASVLVDAPGGRPLCVSWRRTGGQSWSQAPTRVPVPPPRPVLGPRVEGGRRADRKACSLPCGSCLPSGAGADPPDTPLLSSLPPTHSSTGASSAGFRGVGGRPLLSPPLTLNPFPMQNQGALNTRLSSREAGVCAVSPHTRAACPGVEDTAAAWLRGQRRPWPVFVE